LVIMLLQYVFPNVNEQWFEKLRVGLVCRVSLEPYVHACLYAALGSEVSQLPHCTVSQLEVTTGKMQDDGVGQPQGIIRGGHGQRELWYLGEDLLVDFGSSFDLIGGHIFEFNAARSN